MAAGGAIPDHLWWERANRRSNWLKAHDDLCNYVDEESRARTLVKRSRAEIAEVHDTSLRWRPDEAVGYRKIAGAYWDIYAWTGTITNLEKARRYLRIAIKLEPENWLQHSNLGVVLEHLERPEQALASYREALRLADYPDTRAELQQKCAELGQGMAGGQATLDFTAPALPQEDRQAAKGQRIERAIDRRRVEGVLRAGFRIKPTRDRQLREDAISKHGPVCMKCGIDPRDHYPADWALQAVEVHHLTPISESGPVETQIDQVWVVCANCHNVIHAWLNEGGRPDTLREARLFRPALDET